MITKIRYFLIGIFTVIVQGLVAQSSSTMYYMNLPQAHLLNPALRPQSSVYVGLPGLTGINLNINNNFIGFSDVFMKGQTGDSLITFLHPDYDLDDFIDRLKDVNYISPDVSVQLFGLGFSAGKDLYVFIDAIDRVEAGISIPGDLLKLGLLGNEQFRGSKIDLSGLEAGATYFREFGLGFSKKVNNKLRIGAKAKILYGIASVSVDNKDLSITVNDDYSHVINADASINISGPVTVTVNPDNTISDFNINDIEDIPGFLLNRTNMGLGIDLGAVYDVSNRLTVSASIVDLGYIKWKNDIVNLTAKSQFEFNGFNIDDIADGTKTFDEVAQEMLDSLKNSFKLNQTHTPFTTYLPAGINAGVSYDLTKNLSVGILSHTLLTGGRFRESLTLSANANLGNILSTSISYTASNHTYNNLGLGLALRLGIVQFYTIADNIPLVYNRIIFDNPPGILIPDKWNTMNFRIGMNLAFGNRVKKKSDKPMMTEPQIISE